MWKQIFILMLIAGLVFQSMAQTGEEMPDWKTTWQRTDVRQVSPETLLNTYRQNKKLIRNKNTGQGLHNQDEIENDCWFILKTGNYYMKQKGHVNDRCGLLEAIPKLSFSQPEVIKMMKQCGEGQWVDLYFMLQALKKGADFEEARDGITLTTEFPARPLNQYDYQKLKCIFQGKNEQLKTIYLQKMKYLFRNNGCTDGMANLKKVIEKEVENSRIKQEIVACYDRYEKLRPGELAPLVAFQDTEGKNYNWADFRGKVIIADVWATWCCACLEKMPDFLRLREKFSTEKEVVMLSVSIDRREKMEKWKKTLHQYQMHPMLNLLAISGESDFESAYAIEGVPRCIIIGKDGNIIDVFAPSAEQEIEKIIREALK